MRGRRPLGARAGVPAHRHRAGVRQRGERRAGTARERRPARRGVRHHEVLSRGARTRSRRSSEPRSGSGSTTSTCTSSTGRRAGRPGRGREWSGRASAATRARSGCPTSASTNSQQVLAAASVPPVVNQVQFSPYEYRKGAPRRVRRERDRARGLQPARRRDATSRATRRRGSRSASGARRPRCCSAGASSGTFP